MRPVSDRVWLGAVLCVSAAFLSIELWLPLSNDNEIYQSMANELYRFHRWPYIGTWDMNFPGIVFMHWTSIVLFGNSPFGFHLFDACLHVVLASVLFTLFRRWLDARVAFTSVLFYQAHYLFTQSVIGQRDSFAVFFLAVGCLLLFSTRDELYRHRRLIAFATGLAFGMVCLFRVTYLLLVPIPLLFYWQNAGLRRQIAPYILGVCLILGAAVCSYLLQRGALMEAYRSTILFNLELYGAASASMWLFFLRTKPSIVLPIVLGVAFIIFRGRRLFSPFQKIWSAVRVPSKQEGQVIIAIAAVAFLSLFVMRKFFSYHYEILILIGSAFAGIAISACVTASERRVIRISMLLLLAGYLALEVSKLDFTENKISRGAAKAADYLDSHTGRSDRIEVADFSAALRWRVRVEPGTRFTTSHALFAATRDARHPAFQLEWQKEYVDTLRSLLPQYYVVSLENADIFPWAQEAPASLIHTIPNFDRLIFSSFTYDTTIEQYQIYKRKLN
jgi:hypothetical protein